MNDTTEWRGPILWRRSAVLGWVGKCDTPETPWYGRTAGSLETPFIRAEFETEQAAKDFVLFLASTRETK